MFFYRMVCIACLWNVLSVMYGSRLSIHWHKLCSSIVWYALHVFVFQELHWSGILVVFFIIRERLQVVVVVETKVRETKELGLSQKGSLGLRGRQKGMLLCHHSYSAVVDER
mgnify:CR=1 FL=1